MELASLSDHESDEVLDGVFLTQLAASERMSVQHFRIDRGNRRRAQPRARTGRLSRGGLLVFTVDGEEYPTRAGDFYAIPSNAVHAVGVELFSPPRPVPPWAEE